MHKENIRILLIEDNPADTRLIKEMLVEVRDKRFAVKHVERLSAGINYLSEQEPDVILLDLTLPDSQGIDTFNKIKTNAPNIPVVILTGINDETMATRMVQRGAQDYIVKGQVDKNLLVRSIHYAIERKKFEKTIRESERRYRTLFDNAADAIYLIDPKSQKIVDCNPKACDITGYTIRGLRSMKVGELHPPEEQEIVSKIFRKLCKMGSLSGISGIHHIRKGGQLVPIEINAATIELEGKNYHLCIFRDVTERKQKEDSLRESEEKFRALSDSSMDAIIMMDGKGVISYINDAAEKLFGYRRNEAVGIELHSFLVSEKSRKEYEKKLPRFEKTGQCKVIGKTLQLYATRKDGTRFPVELSVSSFRIKEQWHSVGTVRDITVRKRMEEKLQAAVIIDDLTGLLNRRGFFTMSGKQCKVAERAGRKMSILYLDLDNMKAINDGHGHKTGDQALMDVANILNKTFRKSDIIARIGGDEFAVLLTELSGDGLENTIKNHLLKNLRIFNEQGNRPYELSLSVGFTYYDSEQPRSLDDLLSQADALMYKDKKDRQNNFKKTVSLSLREGVTEKRQHERFKTGKGHGAEFENSGNVKIKDISMGGICLRTSHHITAGKTCKIKILSTDNKEIILSGVTVHSTLNKAESVRPDDLSRYDTGLKFIEMDNTSRSSLEKFIAELTD